MLTVIWTFINMLNWDRIASFLNSLCTYRELRPAPAALRFGMGCPGDLVEQGVAFLASLARVFTEKLTQQNWKLLFKLHIGEIVGKVKNKKSFLLHFSFIIIFQKIFLIIWKGILDPIYDPKWLQFSWFCWFPTQKSIFINFGRTNMKTTFGESCSP